MKNKNITPGFTAEPAYLFTHKSSRELSVSGQSNISENKIIPAVPMPYCKTECKWRICGSPLPGYPPPMCYSCEQSCRIHDSGPYLRSIHY